MYFAKILSIEGKVKVGDYYFDSFGLSQRTSINKNNEDKYDYIYKDCKKAQLFLCTKNIKPGDKYFYDGENGLIDCIAKEGQDFFPYSYKIIGKISDKACWLSQTLSRNDNTEIEIKEEDIAWISDDGDEELYFIDKDWDWEEFDSTNAMFAIKCPTCKQFH